MSKLFLFSTLAFYDCRLQGRWTRIVLWPLPAPTPQRSTIYIPVKGVLSPERTVMSWCGTQMQRGIGLYHINLNYLVQCNIYRCVAFLVRRTISVSTQVQGGDLNLYEGMRCHGVPLVTISRGRLVCENDVFMCAEGSGKFYPQRIFPDYLYKKMVQREKVGSLSLTGRQVLLSSAGSAASELWRILD